MKTVLHLFLKDVRQMRRLLVLWLALLATQLASALAEKQTTIADWDILFAEGPKLPIWTLLHWIGLVGLIFEVLLADRAFGVEPCWKTRPIARWQMATAKFAFIALFTVLLPGAFEFFAFTGQGVPAGEAAQGLVLAVLTQTFLVSWVTMLACVCRKKTFEVLVLAPMSLAAPFLIAGMMAWLTERLRESGTFGLLLHRSWTEPPDFLEQPVSWLIAYTLVWVGLPILVGIWLVLAGYLENVRRRAILVLVRLAFCLAVVPVGLLPLSMTQGKPIPITATHVLTAAEMEWKPHWKEQSGRVNNAWLEATFRLPALTNQAGALLLSEYVHGWATIEGRLPGSSRWKEFYLGNCVSSELDGYVNLLLSHTNSPLGRELAGARIVLNPSAAAGAHFGPLTWWDERPLTRWGEVRLALRLELTERELVVVRRLPYADYVVEQRRKPDHLTPDDDAARIARSVFTTTPFLEIPFADQSGARSTAPQKAVLWHPKRREVLLPTTAVSARRHHYGVLAFSDLWRVKMFSQRSDFPPFEKLLPAPTITERAWLAEAELLLLAFKPITNRHHLVQMTDVKLPPVPLAPQPEPRKP